MNDEQLKPSVAQQCMAEIGEVLQKYNCEMVTEEVKRNGQLVFSRIMVIQKESIIKPANGQKVLRMQ